MPVEDSGESHGPHGDHEGPQAPRHETEVPRLRHRDKEDEEAQDEGHHVAEGHEVGRSTLALDLPDHDLRL